MAVFGKMFVKVERGPRGAVGETFGERNVKKRRIIAMLSVIALALGLAGCGGDGEDANEQVQKTDDVTANVPTSEAAADDEGNEEAGEDEAAGTADNELILVDNEFVTIEVLGVRINSHDEDVTYILNVTNNSDLLLFIGPQWDSFSVNGEFMDPYMSPKEHEPGTSTEVKLGWNHVVEDVASFEDLVNVEGDIKLVDVSGGNNAEIQVIHVVLPDGLDLPDLTEG